MLTSAAHITEAISHPLGGMDLPSSSHSPRPHISFIELIAWHFVPEWYLRAFLCVCVCVWVGA